MSFIKELITRSKYKITFEEYWSLNKARLMNSKFSSEQIAKQIWDDCLKSRSEHNDEIAS